MFDIPEQKQDIDLAESDTLVTEFKKICPICALEIAANVRYCPNDGGFLGEPDRSGEVLAGKYEFLELIGEGGMSSVYKARHTDLGRLVAVKILHSRLLSTDSLLRFKREAHTIASLSHRGIVAIHDFGQDKNGEAYIVMDLLEGETLAHRLKRQVALRWDLAISIFLDCCDALTHAHEKNIFHRDIKPSNIILTKGTDNSEHARIIDFGIAKACEEEAGNLTKTGELVGTVKYMSPEQCMGMQPTARSDMYSLACVLYEMLTGVPPFLGDNQMHVIFKQLHEAPPALKERACQPIPRGLEELLFSMLAKDPEGRPADLKAVAESLTKINHNSLVDPGSDRVLQQNYKVKQRSKLRKPLVWGAIAALCAITAGVVMVAPTVLKKADGPVIAGIKDQQSWSPGVRSQEINDDYMRTFIANAPDLRRLNLSGSKVTFSGLQALSGHNKLEQLVLDRVKLSKESLALILSLPNLETLSLRSCNLTDAEMEAFKNSGVKKLALSDNKISDQALATIGRMAQLEQLSASDTLITDKGVSLLAGLRYLKGLDVDGTVIGDDAIRALTGLPIESMDLEKTRITDASLALIGKMSGVKRLDLENTGITDAGVSYLANHKALEDLDLERTAITDKGVEALTTIAALKELQLSETRIGDQIIPKLVRLKNLERLHLSGTNITDASIPDLSKMTHLRFLTLNHCKLTPSGLKQVKDNLPNCRVSY